MCSQEITSAIAFWFRNSKERKKQRILSLQRDFNNVVAVERREKITEKPTHKHEIDERLALSQQKPHHTSISEIIKSNHSDERNLSSMIRPNRNPIV